MSRCDGCKNKRKTWAESLTEKGYNGCVILYDGEIGENQLLDGIDAETIATGWIVLGLATNNQLIVKNVTRCKFQNYTPRTY